MGFPRMDHVSVVVNDLDAAIAFFTELGLEVESRTTVGGEWVDRINNLEGIQVEIVMLHAADDSGKLELTKFHSPALTDAKPGPPNELGLRSVMFEVADIHDTIARLQQHGGELIGEIVDYENVYRLAYVNGPDGAIVSLAQFIG